MLAKLLPLFLCALLLLAAFTEAGYDRREQRRAHHRRAAAFTHSGVLVSDAQLAFVKEQIAAKREPWTSAYNQFISSNYTSLSYSPTPRAVVECGSYSNPNLGCTEERQDAIASYSHALAFYFTGNTAYANKAISIMDAWASTLQAHNNSNAPLQTGWAGASWPKTGELIRHYSNSSWSNAKQGRFKKMLQQVYLPYLLPGSKSNGNWELVMMEAAVGISVFLNNQTSYNSAMSTFQQRVPAYIYLSKDGSVPKTAPKNNLQTRAQIVAYWQGQNTFVDGLTQETCRDFTHTGYGLASIANVAETARIQGNNLYNNTDLGTRLQKALELHTLYENGAKVPSYLCNGTVTLGLDGMTEIGYNALHKRMGVSMPQTGNYTLPRRPQAGNALFIAWQTLTHAEQPN